MRKARLLDNKSKCPVLITQDLHPASPYLTLDEREYLYILLAETAEKCRMDILAWCFLPTGYRMLVQPRILRVTDKQKTKNQQEADHPIARFIQKLNHTYSGFRKLTVGHYPLWKGRYKSSSLKSSNDILLAAISIDSAPIMLNLTDKSEHYYFSSYSHACNNDKAAQQNIKKLLKMKADSKWPAVHRKYKVLLLQPSDPNYQT